MTPALLDRKSCESNIDIVFPESKSAFSSLVSDTRLENQNSVHEGMKHGLKAGNSCCCCFVHLDLAL